MKATAPPPYYRIRLDPPPKIIRTRNNRLENYRYRFPGTQLRVLEINYLQEGNLCEMREEGEHVYEQGTVHILVENRDHTLYSTAPVMHEIFLYLALAEPAVPISEQAVSNWVCDGREAILPEYITEPNICRQIGNLIKAHASAEAEADPLRQLKLRSCMYECLALVTEYAITQAQARCEPETSAISRYTKKACQYIREHLNERFSVEEAAQAAGISYHYLKSIFQQDTGMTVVEYTNHARIQMAEQLITADGMTLEEIGSIVGIPDPTYLSRLFRRYTGMTVQQYRRIHNTKQQTVESLIP